MDSETEFFKITNNKENHHGFQYQDGLNILKEKFNDDPNESCVAGGFYFTTREFIHKFYDYGIYLRVVKLPFDDPDFKMVEDPGNDKWRANKIILCEKYLLDDITTFHKLQLDTPSFEECAKYGFLNIMKFLIKFRIKKGNIDEYNNALIIAAKYGHLEIIKYLVEQGTNIHSDDELALKLSGEMGNCEIVEYLLNQEANIHAENDYTLRWSAINGQYAIIDLLIDHMKNIDKNNNYFLELFENSWFLQFIKNKNPEAAGYLTKIYKKLKEIKKWKKNFMLNPV